MCCEGFRRPETLYPGCFRELISLPHTFWGARKKLLRGEGGLLARVAHLLDVSEEIGMSWKWIVFICLIFWGFFSFFTTAHKWARTFGPVFWVVWCWRGGCLLFCCNVLIVNWLRNYYYFTNFLVRVLIFLSMDWKWARKFSFTINDLRWSNLYSKPRFEGLSHVLSPRISAWSGEVGFRVALPRYEKTPSDRLGRSF
jgi:hypothetical protein